MENFQVAAVLDEIADILEVKGGDDFRLRAYRNAARTVRDLPERIEEVCRDPKRLAALPGIGKSMAEHVKEILATGTAKRLEELRREFPAHLAELMKVPGLGGKKVKLLHEQLGVSTLDELRDACTAHRIRDLPGMGARTEEKVLKGLEVVAGSSGRLLLKDAAEQARALGAHLERASAVDHWAVAGSLRRRRETIGDLDILVQARDRERATEQILRYSQIREVVARGEEKVAVRLASGLDVDFRFFAAESFGAALMYFTGSKAHNIALRKIAQRRGWKLNEYGVFENSRRLAGATEEEVYARLGLQEVPPELREDRGEVEAAAAGKLPSLIRIEQIRGDLHAHTKETDGRNTLEEMVEAARARGRRYIAITDHSKALAMARGLDERRMLRRAEKIHELDASLGDDIWVLAGIEVDILKDGELDLDRNVLAELDWVNASVHSYFDLDESAMTERLLAAIESGVVHAIAHPFGRQIGRREPIRFDVDRVFAACREHGVCMEINSYPDRLDLSDIYSKRAKELGVKLVISTDAHKTEDLDLIEYGVSAARRGWIEAGDVINTMTPKQLRKYLRGRR